jgi:hypothetical protein
MTKYIKDKNGKFSGSIGDGKTDVPTAGHPWQAWSRKCDNCGVVGKNWTPRRWESTGDVEAYCSECTASEAALAEGHSARIAAERFQASQDKWTTPEAIAAAIWEEEDTAQSEDGEEYACIEVGLDGAPHVPLEMLDGRVEEDLVDGGYTANLGWSEERPASDETFSTALFSSKYQKTLTQIGRYPTKEEALAAVKDAIVTRMPRDIAFLRAGRVIPTGYKATAEINGYGLTVSRIGRKSISGLPDAGAPVVSFQAVPFAGDEKSRAGHITALNDGRYMCVVRWEDGARSKPDVAYFDNQEAAYEHTLNLLSNAPAEDLGL